MHARSIPMHLKPYFQPHSVNTILLDHLWSAEGNDTRLTRVLGLFKARLCIMHFFNSS